MAVNEGMTRGGNWSCPASDLTVAAARHAAARPTPPRKYAYWGVGRGLWQTQRLIQTAVTLTPEVDPNYLVIPETDVNSHTERHLSFPHVAI